MTHPRLHPAPFARRCVAAVMLAIGPALLLLAPPASAQAVVDACGDLRNAYGPYDYRRNRDKLDIVEAYHFNAQVESLVRTMGSSLGGDLDYTLRAFPNHHRALISLTRLSERLKNPQPSGARYSVECYHVRAIRFAPDDTVVRLLYTQWLGKANRRDEALVQLNAAIELAKDNALTHYNAGLVAAELGEFDLALKQAHKAMALGVDRPALREMLEKANRWREPGQ